ncbi:hypothetical protein, conserved [Eimeria maxima]|uniref:TerD domain-containing protein n=1 Tax=Eimeria maxima TaxID=5804 RepID=U6M980_EIMMA|nr:hypothetical protein, conserved [Eimeria maxima]CDJ59019.1 hypothetical protein, conserved [Eimeria maxima]
MSTQRLSSGYSGYLPSSSPDDEPLHARSDTFYGRLGSSARDRGHEVTPSRRVSFSQLSALRKICVRLTFDEDAYPGGIDIDIFALLFDSACSFVDCIFYKHPEDASGSFSLNQKTNSLAIDLETVPDTCHSIILAAAVYTTGLSITELEGGLIEICEGFMGPPLFSIDLQSLRANNNVATDKGGLEESQRIEADFALGNLKNLRTLDFVARTNEVSAALRSASGRSSEDERKLPSIDPGKLEKLQSRFAALRRSDSGAGSKLEARLSTVEEEQKRLSQQLSRVEHKLDLLLEGLHS